jgi:tetratricopeptide (TPR) repeat protein
VRIRLGTLDPADYDARMSAAQARVEIGDNGGAVRDLKEMAAELLEKERPKDALKALGQAVPLAPEDDDLRAQLMQVYLATGDFANARECATTAAQFKELASKLDALGRGDEALALLRDAAREDPADVELRTRLAQTFAARGDMAAAGEYLTVESAAGDPDLLLVVAEIRLRAGAVDEALRIATGLLTADPSRRGAVARVGCAAADRSPDHAFALVEIAADASVASGDTGAAAAMLQEFVARAPNHIPALLRLVEVSVDGNDEAAVNAAQSQLADAYLAAGQPEEARFIAEELVAREPWERANLERFRRTLEMLGDPNPEATIADRLGGGMPFTSTDVTGVGDFPAFDPSDIPSERASPFVDPPGARSFAGAPMPEPHDVEETNPWTTPPTPAPVVQQAATPPAHVEAQVEKIEPAPAPPPAKPVKPAPATAHASSEDVEVDLSIVLDDLDRPAAPEPTRTPAPPMQPAASTRRPNLESVFDHVRDEATRQTALDLADTLYRHALALRQAGDIDGCIESLTFASRAPKYRFQTASLLGRLYRERGQMQQAVEWFEKAAQAPAPTQDESYLLLFDLADALEHQGEVARALAICLELQAEAGDYQDVEQRIDRLSKVQARG